jgi:hypothetical protein
VRSGKVTLHPSYQNEAGFMNFLSTIPKKWVVYAKPPYKNTQVVIRYFARYANRTALSDRRILEFKEGTVTIARRRDSAEPEVSTLVAPSRTTKMSEEDFLLRFAQHIVPKRFHRIRYYGLLSPRLRKDKRALLQSIVPKIASKKEMEARELSPYVCPVCKSTNTRITINRQSVRTKQREDSS